MVVVLQMSVVSLVSTLGLLMESGVEELKVLQTILLLVTTTDVVQGKPLSKVHCTPLCLCVCVVCVLLYAGLLEPVCVCELKVGLCLRPS